MFKLQRVLDIMKLSCIGILLILNPVVAFNQQLSSFYRKKYIGDNTSLFLASSRRGGSMSRRRRGGESKTTGFAPSTDIDVNEDDDNEPTIMPKQKTAKTNLLNESSKNDIYSFPALYDLAFGYRSYEDEVQFLLESHKRHNSIEPKTSLRILELAAGPGRHSIAALNQDQHSVQGCTAIDISHDMACYSKELSENELFDPQAKKDLFQYYVDDMRKLESVQCEEEYDTAWLLLGSIAHMITNDDVENCFRSTAKVLKKGGTFILELAHPRETFTMVECTKNAWTVPLEDDSGVDDLFGELSILWGDDDDKFDPIRQVRDFTVSMELKESANNKITQKMKEIVPMRLFTSQEIDALARLAGFQVVEMFGALDEDVDINNDEEAYRLVCILKK